MKGHGKGMLNGPKNQIYGKKMKIDKKTITRLLKYIFKNNKLRFFFVICFLIISSVVGVVGQLFLKTLIDNYIAPLMLEKSPIFTGLINALLIMAFIYLIGIISSFLYNRLMIKISQGVLKEIRDDMFKHMQTLPISYFDKNSHGDIMSKYTNDTDALRQMISQTIPQSISSFITVIAVLCAMIYLSPILTIFVIISVVLMMLTSKKIISLASKYFINQQKSLGNLNGFIEEMMEGQKVIKVFTHEEKTKNKFDELNSELCDNTTNANKHANTLMPILHNFGNIIYVFIAFVGGYLAIHFEGFLSLGSIAAFLTLTKTFIMPINQISQQISFIIMALAGATRIFELLDVKSEENEGKVTLVKVKEKNDTLYETKSYTGLWAWKRLNEDGSNELIRLKGDVRFFDVHFSYEEGKEILHDINMYAKPGQKIAFVGATGAGKTTITNLINRFYDIDSGKITYDGIDIKEINKNDLRLSLGMVLQDINLFTGTILENIKYGKMDATDEECKKAAKLANAEDFINMLPNGYDTVITGNGRELSQGQRQLLAIARSAIANPPVMILDEATSSIDTRTEKMVQDGMDKLMKDRTVFVIAHRISTIRNSKAIIVLEDGKIIERGNHEELTKEKGKYYELSTGLFELE